jgi:hypothetical protein
MQSLFLYALLLSQPRPDVTPSAIDIIPDVKQRVT